MNTRIFIEGGGESKALKTTCRAGFRRLLEKCQKLTGRMPRLIACGSRSDTFDDFKTALKNKNKGEYVGMLIDSEEPLDDLDHSWKHVKDRDGWEKPANSTDDQVLFMTTCMETWIICDQTALEKHYGSHLNRKALIPPKDLENRSRKVVLDALVSATKECSKKYKKGKRSFEVLGELTPETLEEHLPSFKRVLSILKDNC